MQKIFSGGCHSSVEPLDPFPLLVGAFASSPHARELALRRLKSRLLIFEMGGCFDDRPIEQGEKLTDADCAVLEWVPVCFRSPDAQSCRQIKVVTRLRQSPSGALLERNVCRPSTQPPASDGNCASPIVARKPSPAHCAPNPPLSGRVCGALS